MSSKTMSVYGLGVNAAVVLCACTVRLLACAFGLANASFNRPSAVVESCAAMLADVNAYPFGSTTPSRYPLRLRTQTMASPFI